MARKEPSSGFFFDVAKWRGSRTVQRMSFSERGVYFEMMCEQWEKRSLPDSAQEVAEIIAVTTEQAEEVGRAWKSVRRNFEHVKGANGGVHGHIANATLEATRRKQDANRRKHQENGAKGGNARARNRLITHKLEPSQAKAPPSEAVAKSTDLTRLDMTRQDVHAATNARAPERFATGHIDEQSEAELLRRRQDDRSPSERIIDAYRDHWRRVYRQESSLLLRSTEAVNLLQQLAAIGELKLLAALAAFFASSEQFLVNAKHPFALFLKDPTKYLASSASISAKPAGCRHDPPCVDDAAHTRRVMADKREVPQ